MDCLYIISMLLVSSACISACPEGWVQFKSTCFLINRNLKLDWPEASSDCRSMNAELAIVDDAETMRFLATEINPNGTKPARGTCQIYDDFWIDGTDQVVEGHWIWASSSEPVENNYWCPGNPSDSFGHEDCLELLDGHWNDDTCTKQQHFICEKENEDGQAIIG